MPDVTVKQLAQVVGIPVERLLTQLKDAGLSFDNDSQTINEEQKRVLLAHLKKNHGATTSQNSDVAPERITLRRKSVSKVKVGNNAQKPKTVNVEVRKKRTYVKRSVLQEQENEEKLLAEKKAAEEAAILEQARLDEEARVLAEAKAQVALEEANDVAVQEVQTETELPSETATAIEAKEPETVEQNENIVNTQPEIENSSSVSEAVVLDENQIESKKTSEPVKADSDKERSHAKHKTSSYTKPSDKSDSDDNKRGNKKSKKSAVKHGTTVDDDFSRRGGGKHKKKRDKVKKAKSARQLEAEEVLKQHTFAKPTAPTVYDVAISETITVADLAKKMSVKAAEVIKVIMGMGAMATINQVIDQDTAILVVEEMGHRARVIKENALEEELHRAHENHDGESSTRAPVVTIMGHVDHGKTSLLDHIRATRVAAGEAGGITQHIGAYHVDTDKGSITFLDTPGHAAFTAMRARGADVTDIVILIVAADDGVKPQTVEAIQHAKAAKVPIIVAVNKMDKPEADPDRVKNELSRYDVIPEEWGGDNMFVNLSAKTGDGIDELLDSILLQSEVLELEANSHAPAKGVVVESRLDKGRGPVATVLVQNGTLRKGDILLAGLEYGKVRALIGDSGDLVEEAGPSIPVEVLGLSGIPRAGDDAITVVDDKKAREVALFRQGKYREVKLSRKQKSSLEGVFESLSSSTEKVLNLVLKADVQGSVEAITESLEKMSTEEVKVSVVASGVGGITESDVHLAVASSAVMVGFNVRADGGAKKLAESENISIHYYSVIYDVVDQVKQALTGMLAPEFKEQIVGVAQVRDVFRSPKIGAIAGCMVIEGTIKRNNPIRVLRDNVVIYEGTLESLRRFKDDVLEVRQGFECGIGVKNYNDVRVGDQIEVFETIEVKRELTTA